MVPIFIIIFYNAVIFYKYFNFDKKILLYVIANKINNGYIKTFFYISGKLGTSGHLAQHFQDTHVHMDASEEAWEFFNENNMKHSPNIT